ncbi:MAG: ThiF family adenylyltransferase [Sulfurospirillum sp.]|nr:ThiF family adenylyltransferase [Sulfurospirillum sp.]
MDRFQRCRLLFGDDFEKIQNAKILLFGVGGVGGHCLDALYRSGVSDITIVDFDTFEITNQNRQLGSENLGAIKVEALKKTYPSITALHVKVTPQWVDAFDFDAYDVVLDAIDDIPAKVAIALKTHKKLISSMGGAKRIDPSKIITSTIWKTYGDGLAKKFRYELKKAGFKQKFEVIFSSEEPKCVPKGSFVGVTGSFGLMLASRAIAFVLK